MAQAIVDPQELRRFAQLLKHFNDELRERMSLLHSQLLGLAESWRDQEHEHFVQEFEQTLHVVEGFLGHSDEHVPFLLRKAERVEEYLHQHRRIGPWHSCGKRMMDPGAHIKAVAILADFRAALLAFADKAAAVLDAAALEVRRQEDRLAEQLVEWQALKRKAEDHLFQVKNELARRKMMRIADRPPDCSEQEEAVYMAERDLDEIDDKIRATKEWIREYPHAVLDYQGRAQNMRALLETDLPRMTAFLDRAADSLEAYLHT